MKLKRRNPEILATRKAIEKEYGRAWLNMRELCIQAKLDRFKVMDARPDFIYGCAKKCGSLLTVSSSDAAKIAHNPLAKKYR